MALAIRPDYVNPINTVEQKKTAAAAQTQLEDGEKGDLQELQARKQTLSNQILMTKGATNAGAASEETQKMLQKQLDEVSAQIRTAEQQSVSSMAAASLKTPRFDEYVKGEDAQQPAAGLYSVGQDESGSPVVRFDAPTDGSEPAQDAKADGAQGPATTKTTVNTDQVDAEIKQLKQQAQQLQTKLRQAAGDEQESAALEQQLAQLQNEITQKDTDTYRKQHATVTQG